MFKTITWNTGRAAERARHNLKLKKNKKIKKKESAQARKRSSTIKRTTLNGIEIIY